MVFERNRPTDTFGFGVVFSDATLRGIDDVDPLLLRAPTDHGVHWDEIEVRIHGEQWRCGGNGMAAIARMTLLRLLHEQPANAGVDLRFEHDVPDPLRLSGEYDLVVGADGGFAVHGHPLRPDATADGRLVALDVVVGGVPDAGTVDVPRSPALAALVDGPRGVGGVPPTTAARAARNGGL